MTDNVVYLSGEPALPPGEPVPDVIAWAEGFLERALAGEVIGFCTVVTYGDGGCGSAIRGQVSYSMVGYIEQAKLDILKSLED